MVLSVIEYGDIIYSNTSEGNSNKIIVTKHRGRMPQDGAFLCSTDISGADFLPNLARSWV